MRSPDAMLSGAAESAEVSASKAAPDSATSLGVFFGLFMA